VVRVAPAGGAQGLLIAGRGKAVSGADAARVLAKVPKGTCPCPITIYLTLPRERVHNVRRYRIAIVGDGYHGLLVSNRTKVPGLVSIYDLEPTVNALDRGEEPPLTSRPAANLQETLRRPDRRLTESHDSRSRRRCWPSSPSTRACSPSRPRRARWPPSDRIPTAACVSTGSRTRSRHC